MQRTNEEELDLFCDLLDPVAEVLNDKAVSDVYRGGNKLLAIKNAIRNHKGAVIQILALIDGVAVEKYRVTAVTLPVKLLTLVNMPEVQELFSLQGQVKDAAQFGSATENIEDGVL